MEFTAKQIADYLQGKIEGNPDAKVSNISRIEEGLEGTLSFLANPKYNKYLYTTKSSIVLINETLELEQEVNVTLIRVKDAYKAFASLLQLYESTKPQKTGIDKQAAISESASVGENCYIGTYAVLGENVKVGNNVKIYPQVYLGDNVKVGDNAIIYAGVKIYHDCIVGNNCIIHSGSVIGSDGFGFAQSDDTYQKIPQLGNVILEDNVEIGSNVSIDRATMGSTILHKGVKLDNLIQIAHNVEVGENTAMAAQAGVSGSTKVGKNCILAGQAGLVGHITIADKVIIGAQSGVSNSVTKEGDVILGSPAFNISDARRSIAVYRKLPDLYRRINELEKALDNINKNI